MKKALVIIDMQNDFVTGSLGSDAARSIVPNVCAKVDKFLSDEDAELAELRKTDMATYVRLKDDVNVFMTLDTHYAETYGDTVEGQKLPVEHCIKGNDGWGIVPELFETFTCHNAVSQSEFGRLANRGSDKRPISTFTKETFGSIALAQTLAEKQFDEIEFIGLVSNICVVSNVLLAKAVLPNTRIIFDASCSAGTTPKAHNAAIEVMRSCHIDVIGL